MKTIREIIDTAGPASRLPSMQLGLAALLISLLIAIPAGVISAARRNTAADYGASILALCGLSLPSFWVAILLILSFSIRVPLLPSSGYVPFGTAPLDALRHIALPALTLGVALAAASMRMTRSAMLDALGADYIRTARAKGLPRRRVLINLATDLLYTVLDPRLQGRQ